MFTDDMGGWKGLGIHIHRGMSLVTGLHGRNFGARGRRLRWGEVFRS